MEPALTNRIIHSHPAPGCTGPVYRARPTEWASGDIFTADIRARLDAGLTVCIEDRWHVDPIAFYNRILMLTNGVAA